VTVTVDKVTCSHVAEKPRDTPYYWEMSLVTRLHGLDRKSRKWKMQDQNFPTVECRTRKCDSTYVDEHTRMSYSYERIMNTEDY